MVLLVVLLASWRSPAQCPYIPWDGTERTQTTWTVRWRSPPGAPAGAVYEVLLATYPNFCSVNGGGFGVVATTTARTYVVAKNLPNAAYAIRIRLQSNPCVSSGTALLDDSFTTPPARPVITRIEGGLNSATLVFTYYEPRALGPSIHRAGADGVFRPVDYENTYGPFPSCNPVVKRVTDGPLAHGTYWYRMSNSNNAGVVTSAAVPVTVGPRILSFTASTGTIRRGESATLSWSAENVASVSIDHGVGAKPASGTVTVSPSETTKYTLTASAGGTTVKETVTVNVLSASLRAVPSVITSGQVTTLVWEATGATTVELDQGLGLQRSLSGVLPVTPPVTTMYTLTAKAEGVSVKASVIVTVHISILFVPVPPVIRAGQTSALVWNAEGASEVVIDQGIGKKRAVDWHPVTPPVTTAYTLNALMGPMTFPAIATVHVIRDARVGYTLPAPLLQPPGVGGATATYVLRNAGGASAALKLTQSGSFFSQTPTEFTLGPGSSQIVTVTGLAQPAGTFEGASIPGGDGVPAGARIPIRMLSAMAPAGSTAVRPLAGRIDAGGSIAFTNGGSAAVSGILTADVPWLVPQSGAVVIPPGQTVSPSFVVDRARRPAGGAAAGRIALDALDAPLAAAVKVIDTSPLSAAAGNPPPLEPGEVALFAPGCGHVRGSVGLFLSDLSILNRSDHTVGDVRLYFTPVGSGTAAKAATLPPLAAGASTSLPDVVKNVFGVEGEVGSLQLRSRDAARLSVTATIVNASNPRGTYGTTIPTFRSDRAARAGEQVVLVGLRRDATTHTNLLIQETAGVGVEVSAELFAADGASRGTRSIMVGPFGLTQINDVVPADTVSAILTNSGALAGKFLAYATPVDEASGDNWSVVDWRRQYGGSAAEASVIPVAGTLHGANGTFFHTEVGIMNAAEAAATGTLRFTSRTGEVLERQVSLGARQSQVVSDVIGTLFGIAGDTVGWLRFSPVRGSFAITSRTYTTAGGQPATYGSSVPALPMPAALDRGDLRAMAPIEDAALSTVVAAVPGTFRTNFGLVEISGRSARVRVTLRFALPDGTEDHASRDYDLAPGQFLLLGGLASEILGADRAALGDLRDLEADFLVIEGEGRVVVFTSSVDNGTGDSVLRIE
ncbi:MAG TPA: hypothetical protein VFP80_12540 [Thermoanaerobaculia bacterium]|nr:hypothetical protein [Thermoanaerobaculia bacterium]